MRPIFAIDMGSPSNSKGQNNFGWAAMVEGQKTDGTDIDDLAVLLNRYLAKASTVLGIEAPLVLPLRKEAKNLTSARPGEMNRSWSAGAGASVAVITMPILHYIFANLTNASRVVFFDSSSLGAGDLLVFEAFVTGKAKGESHTDDAALALRAYINDTGIRLPDPGPVINIAAATAMRAGIPSDLSAAVDIIRVLNDQPASRSIGLSTGLMNRDPE